MEKYKKIKIKLEEYIVKLKPYLSRFYEFSLRAGKLLLQKYNQFPESKKWLCFCILIWIVFLPIIFSIHLKNEFTENPQTLYLLSALAQSLAAIFALVFTISLVAAQLFSRYSHRMLANIFDRTTIGYICFFILTIIFSLLSINKAVNHGFVKLVLSFGTLSLLLLIPYFLRFRELLNPEYSIKKLRVNAEKELKQKPEILPDDITRLDNFIMSSLVLKDYDTYNFGVRSLEWLVSNIILKNDDLSEAERTFYESNFNSLTVKLRDIAISGIDDPRSPFVIIDSLKRLGVRTANKSIDSYSASICEILGEIGSRACQKGVRDIVNDQAGVLYALRYICNTALKNRLNDTLLVSSNKTKIIAVDVTRTKSADIVEKAITQMQSYALESISFDFKNESGINMATNIILDMKDIGISCIENAMHDSATLNAQFIGIIGVNALANNIEDTVVSVVVSLRDMSHRACEGRFTSTSKSIVECLYNIGLNTITNSFDEANRLVAESLMFTVFRSREFNIQGTLFNSAKYLIQLGVEATLNTNEAAQNIYADALYSMYEKDVPEADILFNVVQSDHETDIEYISALTQFKELYIQKKS